MDAKLLELLVCPVTKGPLQYDRENQELISQSAQLAYPVRDGIPVLLEAQARSLADEGQEDADDSDEEYYDDQNDQDGDSRDRRDADFEDSRPAHNH